MRGAIFITGTDTGVGKTLVACALLQRLREDGHRVCGFKPVASGCARAREGLRNADALALQQAAGTAEPYEAINPYALEPAVAPHLAAAQAGTRISIPRLNEAYDALRARHDLIVVEGAGGWRVPLDEVWTLGEWAAEREWPVILVVGMRLGCLNHALLSAEAIARRTRLVGWIANALPPAMPFLTENIEALRERISAPLLGTIPVPADPARAAQALDIAAVQRALRGPKPPPADLIGDANAY